MIDAEPVTDSATSPRAATLPPLPPSLAGLFDVLRPLGMGGMGAVWLVRDPFLDRPVALKVLLDDRGDAERRERFLREARTSARLEHPHIIDNFQADETDGTVWFTMRYVDGESLGDRLRDRGRPPLLELLHLLREVAWGLAYAHARGVVHRDIKPDNILLDKDSGRAVVTDFGIARDHGKGSNHLTLDGYVLGSVQYMSPEQASGDVVDGRTDLYALGCVAYLALTGQPLFDGPPQSVLVSHVTRAAPRLLAVAPDVPSVVGEIVDRCLQKDPAARFDNADQLATALEKAIREVGQLEKQAADAAPGAIVTEDAARLIWQRAAQLQAAAAHRLERTARLQVPVQQDAEMQDSGGFRMRDVEEAAVEAGISRQYVALALAEHGPNAPPRSAVVVGERLDRQFSTMLGTTDRAISVSRTIPASPKETLASIVAVFTAEPFRLAVKETINGHPLDGGILRFSVPRGSLHATVVTHGGLRGSALLYRLHQIDLYDLNVTLHARGTVQRPACEVVITGDLRYGMRRNLFADWAFTGGGGLVGGVLGTLGLVAVTGSLAVAALPAVGVAAVSAGATAMRYRWLYRSALAKATEELGELLAVTELQITQRALFQ